ncbi:hypothetical protein MJO28_002034 [Puccinia striiformis f. sp. tritici]|uniref:Uncharacterized protein n=1 Tax=Puccinia striiformis f. sp. tritici TaxID=168172 RepID=A0ACC0EV80_9BASI|nr:hypothetical protein MJO28_002034 [Puccinia striiformis f. sp. tritici]
MKWVTNEALQYVLQLRSDIKRKKRCRPGPKEREEQARKLQATLLAEQEAKLAEELAEQEARLAREHRHLALREPFPTESIKSWQKRMVTVKNDQDEDSYRFLMCGLPSQEKRRLEVAAHTYIRGGRGHATEDKSVVGYITTAFLEVPAFKNEFHSYKRSFVLTYGNQAEVAAICIVTKFADMSEGTFQKFNQVTTTLRFMEKVRAQVTTNGAMVSGRMYAHGFRRASTNTGFTAHAYANPDKSEVGEENEKEGIKRMIEVDRFLQTRAWSVAHGCIAANNKFAEDNSIPAYSWDHWKNPTEGNVETVLGSNLTWTREGFSNKSHLDSDSSPFAYVLSAPSYSADGSLARTKDYDVTGGEFLFASLKYLIDINSTEGIVEILWKANQIQHQTMASVEPSGIFTRSALSIQMNKTLATGCATNFTSAKK